MKNTILNALLAGFITHAVPSKAHTPTTKEEPYTQQPCSYCQIDTELIPTEPFLCENCQNPPKTFKNKQDEIKYYIIRSLSNRKKIKGKSSLWKSLEKEIDLNDPFNYSVFYINREGDPKNPFGYRTNKDGKQRKEKTTRGNPFPKWVHPLDPAMNLQTAKNQYKLVTEDMELAADYYEFLKWNINRYPTENPTNSYSTYPIRIP